MAGEVFNIGLVIRRKVLGVEHVEDASNRAGEVPTAIQEHDTEIACGSIWTRPDLPRKTCGLLRGDVLTGTNRPRGLELRVRSDADEGFAREEIEAVILQVAGYAGVPTGFDGFLLAREAIAEAEAAKK